MKLTGQKLKEKREAARLTISEVSLATKINPKVLTAMEAGDSEHLPAKTFLRGFVRAYAGFLKMNVNEILETFTQETGEAAAAAQTPAADASASEPAVSKRETPPAKVDVDGEGSGTFRMFVIGGVLVLIVLIIGVRSVVQKYERERINGDAASDLSASKVTPLEEKKDEEKKDGVTPPPASAPIGAVGESTANSSVASSGTQSVPNASTSTDDKAAKVAEEKAAQERKLAEEKKAAEEKKVAEEKRVAEEKKAAEEKAVAEKKAAEEKAAADKKAAEEKKAADAKKLAEEKAAKAEADKKAADEKAAADKKAAEDKKPASKGKRHEIILEALDKVEVSFNLKGETKKIPMSTGQVHTIVTDEPVSFDISDGGALNITDNGRDKGPAGDLGHRKQVSIP